MPVSEQMNVESRVSSSSYQSDPGRGAASPRSIRKTGFNVFPRNVLTSAWLGFIPDKHLLM